MSTFIFTNEDSDDEEPVVKTQVPNYIAKQDTEKPVSVFKPKSKLTQSSKQDFELEDDDFPSLGNISPMTRSIGMWNKKSTAHEYTETNVVPTIKMPPIFAKRRDCENDVVKDEEIKDYLEDDESDVEFINEEELEEHEVNPELSDSYTKGGW